VSSTTRNTLPVRPFFQYIITMWHSFKPKNSVWYRWRLNGASAYLRKDHEAWQIAFRKIHFREHNGDFGGPDTAAPPEDLPVIHAWGTGESVFLHPFLCTLPYVFRLREKLRVAPGRHCCFTVALPPRLKFELTPEKVLAEEMPFTMSRTFHGSDIMHGEVCHSLRLAFGSDGAPHPMVLGAAHVASGAAALESSAFIYCDVHIRNNTKDMLELERAVVNPEPLSVYSHNHTLVTDALELDYSDADCKLRVCKNTSKSYHLVSAGIKYSAGESFARRSVDIIKDITTI